MTSATFNQLYRKLNPRQKEAVDTIEGPVMVIAGPGTGKTQILTLRIANILRKTDTSPDSILALTFTESGVFSMRKRLVEIIGSGAYRVHIYTFHGFANDLISQYPDRYPRIVGSKNINDIDKIGILKEILDSLSLKTLKPFGDPYHFLHPIRSAISELKRENISPQEALRLVREEKKIFERAEDKTHTKGSHKGEMKSSYSQWERRIEKCRELVKIYERYEGELNDRKLYDYEDMITETLRALEGSPDFLLSLQEEYQYILADEHQDANNSQNRLLELLASFHESPNLFLVGDEKQAIYRFQGASLENFLYFKNQYPSARVIQLEDSYRSVQTILNASHTLIGKGKLSPFERKKPLKAAVRGEGMPILLGAFSRPDFEYAFIAQEIERHIAHGVPPEEIAVLYRNNSDVDAIIPALEREGIPYTILSDQDVLSDRDMQKFITLLRAIHAFGNDERLVHALYLDFLRIEPLDTYRLLRRRAHERIALFSILKSKKHLKDAGVKGILPLHKLFQNLSEWSIAAKNRSLLETLETIARDSGFWGHIIGHDRAQEKLDKYGGLIREAEMLVQSHRDCALSDFIRYLDLLVEHRILVKRRRQYTRTPSVQLMTAHKAKGLEFDYVFITGARDGHWGGKGRVDHFSLLLERGEENHDPTDDERRLFYVSLTRARFGAAVTYAKEGEDGREHLPTQFVEEIDKRFVEAIDTKKFEKTLKSEKLLLPRTPYTLPVTERKYLNELFFEQGLSVTALNNYLKDPWEYFFINLLRVPKAPSARMLFGNAIHGALHDLLNRLKEGKPVNKAYLLSSFDRRLAREPFSERAFDEALAKGETVLSKYFDHYRKEFAPVFGTEMKITAPFRIGAKDTITLTGILDKVEIIGGNRVRVTDYKTGRIRSRNEIEGKTKTSLGEYKRQLVFYKLLLSFFEEGKYEMEEGVIDFIEPDHRGRFRREVFRVSLDEVEELKKLIRKSADEIIHLDFWKAGYSAKSPYAPIAEYLTSRM